MDSALINPISAPLATNIIPPKPTGTGVLDFVTRKRTAEEEASASTLIQQPSKKKKTESFPKQYKFLYTWLKDDRAKIKSLQEQENRSTVESETTKQVERVLDLGLEAVRNPRSVGKRVVKWQRSFEMLVKYKEKYGSCDTQRSIENMIGEEKNERNRLKSWVRSTTDQLTLFEKDPRASTLDPDRVKQLKNIGFVKHVRQDGNKLPPRGRKSWDENFNDLQAFKEENSHTNVPHLPKSSLRNWVVLQRDMYVRLKEGRKSDLNGERVTKLLELEFMLQPSSRLTFDERAAEWLEFKTKHDREPLRKKEDTSEKEESLGAWVAKMRGKYVLLKGGEKTNLTHEQVDKLIARGFKWETGFKKFTIGFVLQPSSRLTFDERAAEWLEFKTKHGREPLRKKEDTSEKEESLGAWVTKMRGKYSLLQEGEKTNLTHEQVDKLTAWGFKWETGFKKPTIIGPRKTWEERFAELCAYKNENGHVNVPQLYPQLGNWVHRQRKDHRARKLGYRNGLNDEKLAKLKDVGFIFLTRKSPRSSKDEPIKTEAGVESEDYTASEEDADIDTDHNGYNDSEHPDQSHEVLQKSYEQDPKIPYASRRQPGIFCN
eukprot:CAMPEP_0194196498 /NCGR_PEP_ID=MMETSP0154-20130528/76697_1 /TAXON_ID=1049557 /ORGANISM="Thalassiothrix antarctica, Strain L6-D1" /LENGTH=600 /DNA_ID=CAMNT_0038921093 /DNA_START=720 /DNA_END=2523 /DNA_ORIENTATION=-